MRRRAFTVTVLVWGTCAASASAAAVPQPVLDQLRKEQRAASAAYARVQPTLVAAARAQREAQAAATQAGERRDVVELLAAPMTALVGTTPSATFATRAAKLDTAADQADVALDAATVRAASAQGRVLDSTRRRAALTRATSTRAQADVGIGSWRFGSGGPAVSADSLDRYLASKGSPIAGSGRAFLAAGLEHEIDPRLLVAIAGAESYFGAETCAAHNAWGWGCPTSPRSFHSWDDAVMTVARGLRTGYLDDGLTTIGAIHLRYAPPAAANDPTGLNYAWPDNVARFLVEQGGDPQSVAGVLRPAR